MKVVISGSTKLLDSVEYWKDFFNKKGYEVINYPHITEDIGSTYKKFYKDIEDCDIFFLMNEAKNNISGYIGASTFGELTYAVMNNAIHNKKIKIYILDMPSVALFCHDEVVRWLDMGWIEFFNRNKI